MADIRMNLFRDFANAIRHNMESDGYDISLVNEDDEAVGQKDVSSDTRRYVLAQV